MSLGQATRNEWVWPGNQGNANYSLIAHRYFGPFFIGRRNGISHDVLVARLILAEPHTTYGNAAGVPSRHY